MPPLSGLAGIDKPPRFNGLFTIRRPTRFTGKQLPQGNIQPRRYLRQLPNGKRLLPPLQHAIAGRFYHDHFTYIGRLIVLGEAIHDNPFSNLSGSPQNSKQFRVLSASSEPVGGVFLPGQFPIKRPGQGRHIYPPSAWRMMPGALR